MKDVIVPTVTFDPSNGSTDVPGNRNITLTFSESIRKIDNSEIEEMAKQQIQHQLQSSGMQNVTKDIDKFVDNYLKHNKGENYLKIFNQLKSNKVFNHIKEKVTIIKKSITFDKFKLLANNI